MKIAVMGYGTIGSGVVEVLRINKDKIAQRAGEPVDVKYILDLRDFPGDPMEQKIVHGGHPVLRWMMDNIFIRTDPAGNIKPDKE